MKKTERYFVIDFLRGFSMLIIIFIHTGAYFLSNKAVFFLWDAGEFAVVVFIFCSCYIVFKKHLAENLHLLTYVKKRAARLIVPYYIFLIFFLSLVYLGEPKKLTASFLLQNLLVTGGVDINWLVLLFLIFSVLIPVLLILYKKNKTLFYSYLCLALLSSLFFITNKLSLNYRVTMFLPWSLIVIFSIYFVKYETRRFFLFSGLVVSLIFFIFLWTILYAHNLSLVMYNNKYPPNLYHLSYGIFFVFLLYLVGKQPFMSIPIIKKFFFFMSSQSYSIYFVHFLVIYVLTVFFRIKFTWESFFLAVFLITIVIQLLLGKAKHYLFSTLNRGPII